MQDESRHATSPLALDLTLCCVRRSSLIDLTFPSKVVIHSRDGEPPDFCVTFGRLVTVFPVLAKLTHRRWTLAGKYLENQKQQS